MEENGNAFKVESKGKNAVFISKFGTSTCPWKFFRVSHSHGWQIVLMANTTYKFTIQDLERTSYLGYTGEFNGLGVSKIY